MKTIKKINLTIVLIILAANVTFANNYRTFRIFSSEGKLIEIISIIESPVKEVIPGYEGFVSELRNTFEVKNIEVYNEPEVDDFFEVAEYNDEAYDTYASTVKFVNSIIINEETVNDLAFDTKEIYYEYHNEKELGCMYDLINSLMIDETEAIENHFQSLFITSAK